MQAAIRQTIARALTFGLGAIGLLAGCAESGAPDDETSPVLGSSIARIVSANEAVSGAHVPTLDPISMVDAEISQVLGRPGERCEFRYTSEGKPVLAVGSAATGRDAEGVDDAQGVVKINGYLVPLSVGVTDDALVLTAGRIRASLEPDGGAPLGAAARREATLIFEIGDELRAGYRGYYECIE